MIIPILIVTILAFFWMSKSHKRPQASGNWQLVFSNDKSGNTIERSKDSLIDYIKKGNPVCAGFIIRRKIDTTKSIVHYGEVSFITIAKNSEVFSQISPVFLGQRQVFGCQTNKD